MCIGLGAVRVHGKKFKTPYFAQNYDGPHLRFYVR